MTSASRRRSSTDRAGGVCDEEMADLIRADRRHRAFRDLDRDRAVRPAPRAAGGRDDLPIEGRCRRAHAGHRPGRPDAADHGRPARAAARDSATHEPAAHRAASRPHPLLGRPAPPVVLADAGGTTRDLRRQLADGPVVVVFYLGSTCMACVTHLVELDAALPRFRERRATVWAVSADTPEISRRRGPVRRAGDPAPERPGPRGRHRLRRLETDPGRREG